MSATIVSIKPKDGAKYDVTFAGATSIEVPYQVLLSAPLGAEELITAFTTQAAGSIPAIGTEHPARPGYYVAKYKVSQPRGPAKSTLDVTVIYEATGATEDLIVSTETESRILEWGWDDGTSERELLTDVSTNPKAVLNSAGDPFESAPQVTTPAPTFTKVVQFKARQAYAQYLCTVNSAQITIGAMTCPARTLLCSVAEKRNIGDEEWPFTYTIRLRYRSNLVKPDGNANETEIGWDVGVIDAGMREIDSTTGELRLIQVMSKETGQLATVTSPELLDGQGHAVSRASASAPDPTVLIFQAYKRVTFPSWFYSEPGNNVPPPNTNGNANANT